MSMPLLHQTDLFHPHMDPDDHWDLACIYALALQGKADLKGILIDYPPTPELSPDVGGIAQLNTITGLTVPLCVGSSLPLILRDDRQELGTRSDRAGVEFVLRVLRESPRPVVINIVGSCRDIALSINTDPELFAEKCARIYLNSGTGQPHPEPGSVLEYNVALNPVAYSAIFDVACPLYWMPCFEESGVFEVREFGTFYSFCQDEILPFLSPYLQNYFAYMLSRSDDLCWLEYLRQAETETVLLEKGKEDRHMWCTAGFLHAAGCSVTREGDIVALDKAGDEAVFAFEPIDVKCNDNGITTWDFNQSVENRFIFRVKDQERYQTAMTTAMKNLLMTLS